MQLAQKTRIEEFVTAWLIGHLQRKAASCRHNCLVSAVVGGVSSKLEERVASSRKPNELAM